MVLLVLQLQGQGCQHVHTSKRIASSTTAGKLQKFYAEHTSPRSGRSCPSATAAALTAERLQTHKLKTVRHNGLVTLAVLLAANSKHKF